MRKKIGVSFSGGQDTIVMAARTGEILSYENDKDLLHSRYGGRQYYYSRSGLSGAGYLEPRAQDNDLVELGFYRVDANEKLHPKNSPFGGMRIYAPISSHRGVEKTYPVVVVQHDQVVFAPVWDLLGTIRGFNSLGFQEKEVKYYLPPDPSCIEFTWGLHNPHKYRGVRATRFLSIPGEESFFSGTGFLGLKLHIQEFEGIYFHRHRDGYWDLCFENPREVDGEIAEGWVGDGEGLFWRRNDLGGQVQVFIEKEGFSSYEENFSILDWFSKPVEDHSKSLREGVAADAVL